MRIDVPSNVGGQDVEAVAVKVSFSKYSWLLGPALVLCLGTTACKEETKPSPVVVAQVQAENTTNIRICPKCYRRFFGGQTQCTVDGTELIDYKAQQSAPAQPDDHSDHEPVAEAAGGSDVVTPAPAAKPSDVVAVNQTVKGTGGTKASTVSSRQLEGSQVEPVKVKNDADSAPKYQPPPVEEYQPPPVEEWRPSDAVESAPAKTPKPEVVVAAVPEVSTPYPKLSTPKPKAATPAPAVAMVPEVAPRSVDEILAEIFSNQAATSTKAQAGKLSPDEIGALVSLSPSNEDQFTASRTFLAIHYKSTGNTSEYGKMLEELLKVPTNEYNPTIRLEQAEHYLLTQRYQKAVDAASMAERYRQKFPRGDIYYTRLARTYEVLAKSYEGRFSGTEDPDDLDLAIRMWQRYLTHVEKKDDAKRVKMAQESITKLERIKERVL